MHYLHIYAPDQIKDWNVFFFFFFFGAPFEQLFEKLYAGHFWWNLQQLVESPKIIFHDTHKKRYVAFPKQNTWILISIDLNSVLRRETSEKVATKPGLSYLLEYFEYFCPNYQRLGRKLQKIRGWINLVENGQKYWSVIFDDQHSFWGAYGVLDMIESLSRLANLN